MHHNVDHPVSLYAATKKSDELMAHTYASLYNVPCTGLRFFTVYGPWGRPDMAYFSFTRAIVEECLGKKAMKNLLHMQPGDVLATYADVDELIKDVWFKPSTPIEEGIKHFVGWYKQYYGCK